MSFLKSATGDKVYLNPKSDFYREAKRRGLLPHRKSVVSESEYARIEDAMSDIKILEGIDEIKAMSPSLKADMERLEAIAQAIQDKDRERVVSLAQTDEIYSEFIPSFLAEIDSNQ